MLDFSTHRTPNPEAIQPFFEAAAIFRIFFVHALRIDTEEVAERREVVALGRPADAFGASGLASERSVSLRKMASIKGTKTIPKITKNDEKPAKWWKLCDFQGKKPCEEACFGPKRCLFFAFCERNIPIHWPFTDLDVVVLMPSLVCPMYHWDMEKMYQTGRKRSCYNRKNGSEARNPQVWDLNIFLPQLYPPGSKTSGAAHTTTHRTLWSSTSQNVEIHRKFSNWLEPKWHQRCQNPPCDPFLRALQKVCPSSSKHATNTAFSDPFWKLPFPLLTPCGQGDLAEKSARERRPTSGNQEKTPNFWKFLTVHWILGHVAMTGYLLKDLARPM